MTYDADGNQLTVRDPNNVGADMVYDFSGGNTRGTDTFGDVNKAAETIAGVMSGDGFKSTGTAYDDEDRLTGYQQASTNFNQSWSLSAVGDWSSVTTNGTAVTRTHGPTHELLTSDGQSVTTDVQGNQTVLPFSLATGGSQQGFTWDSDNKLKSSDIDNNGSADVTFEYDALGRRVARTEGTPAVVYSRADQQTIADYPRGGAASTATYRHVFASYIGEPVVRRTTGTSGTVLYYHRNQQYSIYAVTDSSGTVSERYAYAAYGQPTFLNASATVQANSAANNRYTYTAREWDATLGLHYFRARWMSGLTGRFLTRDPIGYHDGYLLYASTFATMSAVDPSGLEVEDPKIGCTDFLPEILALDPDDLGPYPRAKEQLQRGPRFFCGDCGFQNYSWQSPDDGGCIICLNAGSPDKHKDEWIAIMIHELTHCDQFQCKGKKAPPRIIDPVPLAPPKKFPGTPEEQCKSCRDWEGNAYKEQCHYLFPGPKNTKKREECIEAGKCYSCNPVCKGVATVAKKCEGLEFPIFVPPRLPPTQPPSPKK